MSEVKSPQETQQLEHSSGVPPAFPTPTTANLNPPKDETLAPQYSQNPTAPVPVPATTVERQFPYGRQMSPACLRGEHKRKTTFGVCGIIAAIFLFPFGLICLFADSHHKCDRCGLSL
ncbi:hypothetical protein BYT27DRAFT_7265414 [Phlegmacium glaucopus]|nr:hypothetical protein BYT27DRAFT_7265414 [Phlegmacium glaucopus]